VWLVQSSGKRRGFGKSREPMKKRRAASPIRAADRLHLKLMQVRYKAGVAKSQGKSVKREVVRAHYSVSATG